jgi:hypothetical protein
MVYRSKLPFSFEPKRIFVPVDHIRQECLSHKYWTTQVHPVAEVPLRDGQVLDHAKNCDGGVVDDHVHFAISPHRFLVQALDTYLITDICANEGYSPWFKFHSKTFRSLSAVLLVNLGDDHICPKPKQRPSCLVSYPTACAGYDNCLITQCIRVKPKLRNDWIAHGLFIKNLFKKLFTSRFT